MKTGCSCILSVGAPSGELVRCVAIRVTVVVEGGRIRACDGNGRLKCDLGTVGTTRARAHARTSSAHKKYNTITKRFVFGFVVSRLRAAIAKQHTRAVVRVGGGIEVKHGAVYAATCNCGTRALVMLVHARNVLV